MVGLPVPVQKTWRLCPSTLTILPGAVGVSSFTVEVVA